ncbi:hypothetical protein IEQ34_001911 [Dendrobium chrysotoxum]|uniref:Uncharacterized protein n=1 Tax=Dendrobium chrysotoxum TaxID=161865 RepID=A0AAV7HLT4_DENCH|nr:hypothetical protein IEQ34_001911 [Dendrobium chrysotoxum]
MLVYEETLKHEIWRGGRPNSFGSAPLSSAPPSRPRAQTQAAPLPRAQTRWTSGCSPSTPDGRRTLNGGSRPCLQVDPGVERKRVFCRVQPTLQDTESRGADGAVVSYPTRVKYLGTGIDLMHKRKPQVQKPLLEPYPYP